MANIASVVFLISMVSLVISFDVFALTSLEDGKGSFERFLSAPSQTWEDFDHSFDAKQLDPKQSLADQVLEYHDARSHRDFPNSMSLIGITPHEYVEEQTSRAEAALDLIRSNECPTLWWFIETMALQNFDEDLLATALELAARLSAVEFSEIASQVEKLFPKKDYLIDHVRRRWIGS